MNRKQAISHMAKQSEQNLEDRDAEYRDLKYKDAQDFVIGVTASVILGILFAAAVFWSLA